MQRIEAEVVISVSDLKKNPSAVFEKSEGQAVAVLNHNRIMGYMIPAEVYEAIMDRLEDMELAEIARARADEPSYPVGLDDL